MRAEHSYTWCFPRDLKSLRFFKAACKTSMLLFWGKPVPDKSRAMSCTLPFFLALESQKHWAHTEQDTAEGGWMSPIWSSTAPLKSVSKGVWHAGEMRTCGRLLCLKQAVPTAARHVPRGAAGSCWKCHLLLGRSRLALHRFPSAAALGLTAAGECSKKGLHHEDGEGEAD